MHTSSDGSAPVTGGRLDTPGRVLLVVDQSTLAEVIKFALNHGVFVSQVAVDSEEAATCLAEWHPHLVIMDMDISHGRLLDELGKMSVPVSRPPIIALTRRGDLKTTLEAFEWGVDDVLIMPFSPEELLARAIAVMRRSYRTAIAFTPTIRLGELEIDILNRKVTVGASQLHL